MSEVMVWVQAVGMGVVAVVAGVLLAEVLVRVLGWAEKVGRDK